MVRTSNYGIVYFKNGRFVLDKDSPNIIVKSNNPLFNEDYKTALARRQPLLPMGIYHVERVVQNLYGVFVVIHHELYGSYYIDPCRFTASRIMDSETEVREEAEVVEDSVGPTECKRLHEKE